MRYAPLIGVLLAACGTAGGDASAPVFEVRSRPSCVPDGPWLVDRVRMVREASQLADLDVRAVMEAGGKVYAGTPTGLYASSGPGLPFVREAEGPIADLDARPDGSPVLPPPAAGRVFACAGGAVHAIAAGAIVGEAFPAGPVQDGACDGDDTSWVAAEGGLWRRPKGGSWEPVWASGTPVSRVAVAGSRVVAAAGDVLAVLDGGALDRTLAPGPGGLPAGAITAVDVSDDGWIAVGHAVGASLIDPASGAVDHFHSLRWLPAEAVTSVDVLPGGRLWVATPAGLSLIEKVPTTLEAKAVRMLDQLDRWFWRMGGFMSAQAVFDDPWADGPSRLYDDDNDGQWTEEAVGALCYAFAVTGEERYYEAARKAMRNMAMLIDVPAADFAAAGLGRGFVTRSLVRDDEGEVFSGKASQSNWHRVRHSDGREYYWKDDTSSDETTGHFFGLPLYFDLCARDAEERAFVADRVTALAGYILDHGFTLPDLDGEPTTHGYWNPDRLAIGVDGPEACVAAGHEIVDCIDAIGGGAFLNSVEILAAMVAAWHVSGDDRFLDAYESLVTEHRYGDLATFNPNVATWTVPGLANYCDHELADLAFLTLNRYDPNPDRRARWTASMLAAWEHEKGERNPLKSLALAAVMEAPPGLDAGVRTLVEYPEDLRDVLCDNSHRKDAARGGSDRFGEPQFATVLPYDEIAVQRWDHNPYRVVGGGAPGQRKAPGFWLLPYWGLRYHGAICGAEAGAAR